MADNGRWRTALSAAFYVVLAAVLVLYLADLDWAPLLALEVAPEYLLLALPFSLGPRLLQPVAWRTLIRSYKEATPPYAQLTLVYAKSWLGRYIPGKVAWIGGKVLLGSRYGISAGVLAATSVAEAGIQLLSALGLAFLLLGASGELQPLGPGARAFSLLALLGMAVLLAPRVFNAVVASVYRHLLRRTPPFAGYRLSGRAVVRTTALYVAIHGIGGVPLFLVLKSVHAPLSILFLPYLTASFLLAGALGTLAVFAPSGIGVREGVLIVLVGAIMPKEIVLLAVVFLRLWSIGMDLLFYALAELLNRRRPFAATPDPEPSSGRPPSSESRK